MVIYPYLLIQGHPGSADGCWPGSEQPGPRDSGRDGNALQAQVRSMFTYNFV